MSNEQKIYTNQCTGSDLKEFCNTNATTCDYTYNPKSYPVSYDCPPGYAKIGMNCMKTINKTKLDNNENFDENNDIVSLFDINKTKINSVGENQVVDKYIIKNCPLFHPIEKDLMLNPVESDKNITTTSRKCKYSKIENRTVYKKMDCFQQCNDNDDAIQCGTGASETCGRVRSKLNNTETCGSVREKWNNMNGKKPSQIVDRDCVAWCNDKNNDEQCKIPLIKSNCASWCNGKPDDSQCNITEQFKQCFIDMYGPEAKGWKPAPNTCPPGWHTSGALTCMKNCDPDYDEFGGVCYKRCPRGFKDVGALCREECIDGYTDVAGVCWRDNGVWTDCGRFGSFGTIPGLECVGSSRDMYGNCWAWDLRQKCSSDRENIAGLCYEYKCPSEWHRTAACSCEGNGNPAGTKRLSDGSIYYTSGRTGLSYVPPTIAKQSYVPTSKGIYDCQLTYGAEEFFNMLGKLASDYQNAANDFGPLICGAACKPGYYNNGFMCQRDQDFNLCYPERKVDLDSPQKTWKKYCSSSNNISKDNECLDATSSGKLSSQDYNQIYKDKCKDKIDRSILTETPDVFGGGKSKNKLLYTTIAEICYQVNKVTPIPMDKTIEQSNLTPNSFYKLNIALPILNLPKDKSMGYVSVSKDLEDAFTKYDLIIDRDILKAIDTGEFVCKYEQTNCIDNVTAFYVTFIRIRYGSTDDDCCLNIDNINLDGYAVNYFNDINTDLINQSELTRVNYYNDLFGSKKTCDPKLKKIEGGNDICRTALNDFCSDTNDDGVPHIMEFTDNTQTNIKHKKCSIDFQKKYKSDYNNILKEFCNDYNESEKKTFITTNKVCKEYCKDDMSNCASGFEKYCIQNGIFGPKCKEFISKLPNKDIIYEKYCALTSSSNVYNTNECKEYRDKYNKCLVNDKGNSECDQFYLENPNITAKIFNKDCDANPTLKYCDKDIIQTDMYKNDYVSTPNKKEGATNVIKSDPTKYFNTSEENIIKNRVAQLNNEIKKEKIKYCLNQNTSECQQRIDEYMQSDFISDCIKNRKDSFEKDEYCINIKNSDKSNFKKYIRPFCNDKDSAAYDTAECMNFRSKIEEKKEKKTNTYIIIGIVIFLIIIAICATIISF